MKHPVKVQRFFCALIALALALSCALSAWAEPAPETDAGSAAPASESRQLDVPLFSESVLLNMPKNTSSYWFTIPEGVTLGEDNYLNLHLTISSTLINERSSISLAVNGTVLTTKWIYDIAENYTCWWKVAIPLSALRPGALNELTLSTTQRSIEGDCADIDNPSNWVRFDPDSYLHLSVLDETAPTLGGLMDFFYDNLTNKTEISSDFIVPEAADAATLAGLFKVASAIGANYPYKDRVDFGVELGQVGALSANKLFIGLLSQWTGRSDLALPQALEPETGYLSIQDQSASAPYYKALITGQDEAGLSKAVDFFSNAAYLRQIDQANLAVETSVSRQGAASQAPNATGYYTFADFGYGSIHLAGAFHQATTLNFLQPNGVRSGDDSYVNIKFRHSKALYSDNSLLTVYFNNVAADSVKLSSSNADGGELKVKIPAEARDAEVLEVRIDVYNYLGKIDCSKDFYDSAWTVIDQASEIYFEPGDEGLAPTLSSFPKLDAFTSDPASNVTMVLPALNDTGALSLGCLLAARAGQSNLQPFDFTACAGSEQLDSTSKAGNLFFVGSFDQLKLPSEVEALLSVVPQAGGFRIAGQLALSPEVLQGKMVFQVIRSPWNFNKRVYVLTYDEGMESQVLYYLRNALKSNPLSGQVAVVSGQGAVTAYSLSAEEEAAGEAKVPLTPERVKYLLEKNTGVPVWMLGVAALLVLIILVLLIKVSRNKKRFSQAAQQMQRANEANDSKFDQVGRKAPDSPQGDSKEHYEPDDQ